jgi:hypothetical protein
MRPFQPYLARAALFSLGATALPLLSREATGFVLSIDVVAYVPRVLALSLGSVHAPSYAGLFIGLFVEWFLLAIVVASILWFIRTRFDKNAN